MGMYDYVTVEGEAFVCSEGHDVSDREFQTKDFDCVLGYIHVGDVISTEAGCLRIAPDLGKFESHFDIGTACEKCPAFVQAETFNLCPVSVDFRVYHQGERLIRVERISESTFDFIASEPGRVHMGGCRGPMPYGDARKRHIDRAFFPWDPKPAVTDEQAAAQKAWRDEIAKMRADWNKKRNP